MYICMYVCIYLNSLDDDTTEYKQTSKNAFETIPSDLICYCSLDFHIGKIHRSEYYTQDVLVCIYICIKYMYVCMLCTYVCMPVYVSERFRV